MEMNLKILINKLEEITKILVGHEELHNARFKLFEVINILDKFKNDRRLKKR